MAPVTRAAKRQQAEKSARWRRWLSVDHLKALVFEPDRCLPMAVLLLLAEVVINVVIVERVPYTEIDWKAYMQEVEGVIKNGTFDYAKLRGDTGPLVYPAGFVWIFAGLYAVTEAGANVRLAQYIFAGLYVVFLALVFRLAVKSEKLPPYALVFMSCASYRIHSLFALRLFNDPIAMLLLYVALNFFISDFWSVGSLFFTAAVSVKMNVLLFAPALFLVYLANLGPAGTFVQLAICGLFQLAVGYPFLAAEPWNYLKGAFDLGRVFLFEWTVNWRFLPEDIFVDRRFHLALLGLHALALLLAAPKWWKMIDAYGKLKRSDVGPPWAIQLLLLPLFMSNFIGLVFARSLHYQFYVWYFHQLPYLAWCIPKLPSVVRLCLLGVIELCWNTYPSTDWSSGLLHGCHAVLYFGLMYTLYSTTYQFPRKVKQK